MPGILNLSKGQIPRESPLKPIKKARSSSSSLSNLFQKKTQPQIKLELTPLQTFSYSLLEDISLNLWQLMKVNRLDRFLKAISSSKSLQKLRLSRFAIPQVSLNDYLYQTNFLGKPPSKFSSLFVFFALSLIVS